MHQEFYTISDLRAMHPIYIQGGDTVRLYHRKHNCYIVAEGCFAGRFAVGRLKQRSQPNSPDWESNEEPDEKEDLVILRNG